MPNAYGNSNNWEPTLSSMSCPSPADSRTVGRSARQLPDAEIGKLQSIVPGSGPAREDDPAGRRRSHCRAIRTSSTGPSIRSGNSGSAASPAGCETRFLDVYGARASFEPWERNLQHRLFDAYAAEVARVDQNGDGSHFRSEETSTRRPTASPTKRVLPVADRFRALRRDARESTTGCWRRASRPASGPGC